MTSVFTVRRRAEEFASAVDADDGGLRESPPQVTKQLADLVRVATLLRAHESPVPRPEFASDLRERLMTEAETVLHPESAKLLLPHRPSSPRQRRLVAAASAAVLIGGTASMAAAAQEALPGEILYPIKRGIERVEAELSLSAAGKGRDLLHAAEGRLTEVEGLIASDAVGSRSQVSDTLVDFSTQADSGATLLFDSFTETRDPDSVIAVRSFAADAVATLESLAKDVPPGSQDELADAALLLHELDQRAAALCGTCASALPELQVPGILLARAEVDRALRAVSPDELDNSHPVVVSKQLRSPDADGSTADLDSAEQLPTGDDVTDAAPPADDPTTAVSPESGILPEGQLETDAPGTPDDGAGEDDLVEDTTDLLGGAVETLLPDPTEDADDLLP